MKGYLPNIGEGIPPPPYYPPLGVPVVNVKKDFEKYVKTLSLKGVMIVDDRFVAFINAGNKIHLKGPGDDYQDKFKVNVVDVTTDFVLISDDFGNKELLEFDFRSGYIVQPIDDVTYITNLGI